MRGVRVVVGETLDVVIQRVQASRRQHTGLTHAAAQHLAPAVRHVDQRPAADNLPEHPAFDWYTERISEQRAVLDELDAAIGDVTLVLVPHLPGEPIGPKVLAELLEHARHRGGSALPGPLRPIVDRESGSGLDAVYRLRLELPQVDPAALTSWLGRRRPDHRGGRTAAPGQIGVRPAQMHRVGRTAARRRVDRAISTQSGGMAGVTESRTDAGAGRHSDIAPELRQLAQTILDKLDPAVRLAAARAASGGAGKCQQVWCPVCALAALVNGEQHPLLTVIAEHSVALLAGVRAMAGADVPEPPDPSTPGTAPTPDDPAPSGPGRYQHIPVSVDE